VLKPFVESMSQEIARALQFFFTSTPHNRVDYVMLAGGSSALPGLSETVTAQTPSLHPGRSFEACTSGRRAEKKCGVRLLRT